MFFIAQFGITRQKCKTGAECAGTCRYETPLNSALVVCRLMDVDSDHRDVFDIMTDLNEAEKKFDGKHLELAARNGGTF